MTTILIWLGSGFAFTVGIMCGAYMARNLSREAKDVNQQTLMLMSDRNDIDRECRDAQCRMSDALEEIALWVRSEDDDEYDDE